MLGIPCFAQRIIYGAQNSVSLILHHSVAEASCGAKSLMGTDIRGIFVPLMHIHEREVHIDRGRHIGFHGIHLRGAYAIVIVGFGIIHVAEIYVADYSV